MSKKPLNAFAKYTGLAFSMLGPILAGVFGGMKLDEYFDTGKTWTIVLVLVGVFAGMYLALKDFVKNSND